MRGKKFIFGAACAVLGVIVALATTATRPPSAVLDLQTAQLADLDGATTTFAELPPSPRLVNFWATWCAPCVHEMPLLEEASQANPSVHFSGISIDAAELARPFVNKMAIKYDIFIPKFDIFLLFEESGNENGVLPYTLLLDEKGGIAAVKIGEFHSAEEIGEFISANLR